MQFQTGSSFYNNNSGVSLEMLTLYGELDSHKILKTNQPRPSVYQNNQDANRKKSLRPSQYNFKQPRKPENINLSRSNLRNINIQFEEVLDELRRKPFAIPIVKVQIQIEENQQTLRKKSQTKEDLTQ